ncbi:30S ribosomal protein S6, partial [Durusdinium trenchii]
MFKTYNLRELEVPQSAWPQASRPHLGAHGYTVMAANGAAIEVLLRTQAYVVKRIAPGGGEECKAGQISWKKCGGAFKA